MTLQLYQTVFERHLAQEDMVLVVTPEQYQASGIFSVMQPLRDECTREGVLYGFLAPEFFEQTGLAYADVTRFVLQDSSRDVYTLSPFVEREATALNAVMTDENLKNGVDVVMQEFLAQIGLDLQLSSWVTPSDYMAPVQYLVAGPVFWRTWFDLTDKVMEIANDSTSVLAEKLNTPVGNTTVKWQLADALASVVMSLDKALQLVRYDPVSMPTVARLPLRERINWLKLDGLKKAWYLTEVPSYLQQYKRMRSTLTGVDAGQPIHQSVCSGLQMRAASGWQQPDLLYVCTSHVPLPVAMPPQVATFYLATAQAEGPLNTETYAPEWLAHNRSVAGMIGLFAIRNYILAHHPDISRIGICSYRKFVSRHRITGVTAEDNWMMDVVTQTDRQVTSLETMMDPGDVPFLVGKPCGFVVEGKPAGYLQHYAYAHHAEDLLRVTATALELGVFSREDASAFLEEREFYIAGIELGVFPADFWLRAVGQIESVLRECVKQHPNHREGYQRRSWAFCAERLSSYMIAKYLRTHYVDPASCYGQLNLLSKENETLYTYGGLTEES